MVQMRFTCLRYRICVTGSTNSTMSITAGPLTAPDRFAQVMHKTKGPDM